MIIYKYLQNYTMKKVNFGILSKIILLIVFMIVKFLQ